MNGSSPGFGPIFKFAFISATVMYAGVAVMVAGAPKWNSPWIPEAPSSPTLIYLLAALSFGAMIAGYILGRRPGPPPGVIPEGPNPWTFTRFIVGAAVTEGAAALMLALSLIVQDSRWAILGATLAAVLLLLAPTSTGDGAG